MLVKLNSSFSISKKTTGCYTTIAQSSGYIRIASIKYALKVGLPVAVVVSTALH